MWHRLRVAFARLLVRGTGCTVTRDVETQELRSAGTELMEYVETSGGLQDPHRIRAYRRVLSLSERIKDASGRVEVAA